jgi:hypothetical protein
MESNNLDEVGDSATSMLVTEDALNVPESTPGINSTVIISASSEAIESVHEVVPQISETSIIGEENHATISDQTEKMDTAESEAKLDSTTGEQATTNTPQETNETTTLHDTNTSANSNAELKPSEDLDEDEDEDDLIKEINEFGTLGDLNEPFGDSFPAISSGGDANNGAISSHTFRKTEWDVKKLENHVRLMYGDDTLTENMSPSQLNAYLKSFFEFAKKSDGMEYEPESLIGFMNSFERYLKTKSYPESLLRSDSFKDARTFLKKKRELVRSIGRLVRTKTNDTFFVLQYHRNMLKEKNLLNRDNPDCLLAEVSQFLN